MWGGGVSKSLERLEEGNHWPNIIVFCWVAKELLEVGV